MNKKVFKNKKELLEFGAILKLTDALLTKADVIYSSNMCISKDEAIELNKISKRFTEFRSRIDDSILEHISSNLKQTFDTNDKINNIIYNTKLNTDSIISDMISKIDII